jgi:hypothetical protein
MARRVAVAANDGRLARAKAEMPLHHDEGLLSAQLTSIGAVEARKVRSWAWTHLLNILTMVKGGLWMVVWQGEERMAFEEGRNGFENLSTSFRLEAAELPTCHVTLPVWK